MPHAVSMAAPGLQALILCGPGSSFPTFTANPDENPKAILPIANRPMVWYPIDFCYRTGITSMTYLHWLALCDSPLLMIYRYHTDLPAVSSRGNQGVVRHEPVPDRPTSPKTGSPGS